MDEIMMKNRKVKKVKFNYVTMLKAVSLLAVSTYHLFSHKLPGGFLGVIIFMIIPGFFLAKSSTRTYDLVEFRYFIAVSYTHLTLPTTERV